MGGLWVPTPLLADRDDVPVPHFGVCLTVPDFHALAAKLKAAHVKFVVEVSASP